MKVLLIGAAGWSNLGDDLIAASLQRWLQSYGATVSVAGGPRASSIVSISNRLSGSFRDRLQLLRAILSSDAVVIGGGGLLDDRLPGFYRPFTRVARVCRLLRKPYIFAGIGVGPVRHESSRVAYRDACGGAAAVFVRDRESADRLRECGVERPVEVVSDPVLWHTVAPDEADRVDVAINLRTWEPIDEDKGIQLDSDAIVEVVAEAVGPLIAEGARISLFSMSALPDDDDANVLDRLRERLGLELDALVEPEAKTVRSLIAGASVVLSMRLHGCLLAASLGRPVVGLAYDPKIAQQGRALGFGVAQLAPGLQAAELRELISSARAPKVSPLVPAFSTALS